MHPKLVTGETSTLSDFTVGSIPSSRSSSWLPGQLSSLEFTSQYAHGILTGLEFEISERSSSEAVSVDAADDGGEALKLLVVFETDEDGWEVASCPTLPGCHSQGRTRDEARANIREAIRGYLASMREHGEPTPTSSKFEVVDVPV